MLIKFIIVSTKTYDTFRDMRRLLCKLKVNCNISVFKLIIGVDILLLSLIVIETLQENKQLNYDEY